MDFELTDEQRMIRDMVRDFAMNEIAPHASEIDEKSEFPAEIIKKMADLGMLGLPFPEKYGGSGADTLSYALTVEELAAASGTVALTYNAHVSLASMPIYVFGTEAQKQKWLVPLASGERLGAFALTEPQAGSDAAALRTRAEKRGGEWVLNGQKMWISNGSVAGSILVAAKTNPEAGAKGISAFIVPADAPGLRVGKDEPKMGMRGSHTNELFFDDCRIPEENLLGTLNEGFKQFMITLDSGRIAVAAMALGLARAAMEKSVAYARERQAFGRPISEFQAIQFKLADMAIELEAARLMIYKTAWAKERGEKITKLAAMAKVFATEAAERVCSQAIQVHGAMGFSREMPVERYYRDCRLTLIGDGTSDIQRMIIGRQVVRGE